MVTWNISSNHTIKKTHSEKTASLFFILTHSKIHLKALYQMLFTNYPHCQTQIHCLTQIRQKTVGWGYIHIHVVLQAANILMILVHMCKIRLHWLFWVSTSLELSAVWMSTFFQSDENDISLQTGESLSKSTSTEWALCHMISHHIRRESASLA